MVAFAIAVDKAQLLAGGAIAREEHVRPVTVEEARGELAAMEDELTKRKARRVRAAGSSRTGDGAAV